MTPQAFRDALARSGITPEKPLYAILTTIHEASETAHAAVTDGARGLTPEGERALIDKVGGEVAAVAEREVQRLVGRLDLRQALQLAALGLVLLGAGYGVGRWDGERQGARGVEGASFMAQISELNSPSVLREHCERHGYQQGSGIACRLPPVWVRR